MNAKIDKKFWNKRYEEKNTGWDIGYVSTPIKNYIDQLKDKSIKILIPGAGNGYEAEYLHKQGFVNVFVIDISKIPLKNLKKRVTTFPEENLIHGDFFVHDKNYDLIIEQTFFCAINPELRKNYVDKMHQLLKPKRKLVGLLFNTTLNIDHPPFGGNKTEYTNLFRHKFLFKTFEEAYNSIEPRAGKELFINFIKK